MSIHPTSGNITFQDLDMIKAAGISFVRTDLFWNQVETTAGVYNFSTNGSCDYDAWSQACAARGLRMVYTLDYNNPIYGSDPSSLAWRQAYANYAAAAVNHFKGDGNIYQVWQEPDGSWSWPNGVPSASQYMAMANLAVPAMRRGWQFHDMGSRH